MSKKNFKVETAANGQTPKQDTKYKFATVNIAKDKTPTGKVKTIKDKEALKKEHEEQYKNFRVAALKRRAKRMGLSEEQTKVKIEELLKQIAAPTNYDIMIMFDPADFDMVKQALMNDDITWKILVTTYGFLEGDAEVLASLRKILPPKSKIYPHVKRKPNVLPNATPYVRGAKKRTKAEKKALAKTAKAARKALNRNKGHNVKSEAKIRLEQFLKAWHSEKGNLHGKKAKRKAFLGTQGSYDALPKRVRVKPKRQNFDKTHVSKKRRIVIPKTSENVSKSVEMASTDIKKAA